MTVDELSDQHKAIAMLVRCGYSNKQIARKLGISPGHVNNQLTTIYNALSIKGGAKRSKLAVMLAGRKSE
jgi:DNA-binding NarL/FixJ family response regulator